MPSWLSNPDLTPTWFKACPAVVDISPWNKFRTSYVIFGPQVGVAGCPSDWSLKSGQWLTRRSGRWQWRREHGHCTKFAHTAWNLRNEWRGEGVGSGQHILSLITVFSIFLVVIQVSYWRCSQHQPLDTEVDHNFYERSRLGKVVFVSDKSLQFVEVCMDWRVEWLFGKSMRSLKCVQREQEPTKCRRVIREKSARTTVIGPLDRVEQ